MPPEIVLCPECAAPAEVIERDWLPSTAGPVEHIRVRCVQRHCFLMPAESLASRGSPASLASLGAASDTFAQVPGPGRR